MSEPLTFTVQMSFEDYLDANKAVVLRAWKPIAIAKALLRMAALVVLLLLLFALVAGDDPLPLLSQVPLAIGLGGTLILAVCFVFQWFNIPRSARKMFEQLGTVELPTSYSLTLDRFESSFAQGNSLHPWGQFVDYVESDRMIMIRRTQWLFFGIPKAQLDAATQTKLIELLDSVGLKQA